MFHEVIAESFSTEMSVISLTRAAGVNRTSFDLLFVDGPPAATGHQARYPALPLLSGLLSPLPPSS